MTNFEYVGGELDVFQHAHNWKTYWSRQLTPWIGREVLEVGAGLGANTALLCDGSHTRWLAIEPDDQMYQKLVAQQAAGAFANPCQFAHETVQTLSASEQFDTIMYIDVLEHIEADAGELAEAARHLQPHGHLIVLAPAYPFLYTAFDAAIGHYRRYTRQSLLDLAPPDCTVKQAFYLDTVGLLASLGNRLLLRDANPSLRQILFWDRFLVPPSRVTDWLVRYRMGRSVICVWQKSTAQAAD